LTGSCPAADGAGYAATYKELEGVECENLKRVGMLGKQG
jgi:hypothetical protein